MTGSAGGCGTVIPAQNPGGFIHVHLIQVTPVSDVVLRFSINFHLGMIRSQVTTAAGFGGSGLGQGEVVPGVTGGTGTGRSVGINPADTEIGPCISGEFSVIGNFHEGTVALLAAVHRSAWSFHHFPEKVVQTAQYFSGLGVMGRGELFRLQGVAFGTVCRGYDCSDECVEMFKTVDITLIGKVAFGASDTGVTMAAPLPAGYD